MSLRTGKLNLIGWIMKRDNMGISRVLKTKAMRISNEEFNSFTLDDSM
jgi:hypothetical protein